MKKMSCKAICFFAILYLHGLSVFSQTEIISSGSFIINMGATNPNTVANGIKPYGLVYDLIRNYSVPVRWVISQTKVKDGPDFTYNGIQYKGGTFIIPAEYRTTVVNTRITYWTGLGVVGVTTTSALTVDVTYTIKAPPRWTLDIQNGAIAEGYLINAGITNAAFPGAYNWKSPQTLGSCDDFFVMPHAEPTWATHSNLLAWNRDYYGTIWAACHAVSALENMVNPASTGSQTNFLTAKDPVYTTPLVTGVYANSNSLLLWTAHSIPSAPFTTRLPTDPVAQFMGLPDAALIKGSETVYIPRQNGGITRWNPGVKMITYDPSQTDVTSPNPDLRNAPALIVYGRAFDDATRGYVMYEAGHSMRNGTVGDVAGQRAFFNFSLFQTTPKAPQLSSSGPINGQQVSNGTVLNLSVSASSPLPGMTFTYAWTATCGGLFSAPTSASTTFTPSGTAGVQVISCTVTDNCGRASFQSFSITILPPPAVPNVTNDAATISGSCPPGTSKIIDVLANDIPNTSTISFTSLNQGAASPAEAGIWSATAAGIVTFTPDANFNGTATITYTVTNTQALTNTATISITVGDIDINGCSPNSVYAPADISFSTLANYFSSTGVTAAALNGTQLDDNEGLYSSTTSSGDYLDFGTAVADNLILAIGSVSPLRAKDSINLYWKKNANASIGTISVQIGVSSAGPWTNAQTFSSSSNPSVAVISKYALPTGVSGITHVRINAGTVSPSTASATQVYLDAVEYEYLSCIPKNPQLSNDATIVLEDQFASINVLNNDTDPQGLSLTLKEITSAPTKGKVSINTNGTITYISNTDVNGADNFSYSATNTEGYIDTASVSVTINADGCGAGQYKASSLSSGTKVFQYQFYGTDSSATNATAGNFADAYLRSKSGNTGFNYGAATTLQSGGFLLGTTNARRGVFKFDISRIPTSAVVQSAVFTGVVSSVSGSFNKPLNVHQITKTWVEGTNNGTASTTSATWTNWTTAGGDFNATISAATTVTAAGTFTWDITSLAQNWITTPANNFGILMKCDELGSTSMYAIFVPKEGTAASRPKLTITYVVPVACATIPNRNPLANPNYTTTLSGQMVTISPLTNDGDVDAANTITVTGVIQGANGTATYTGSTVSYTPNTSAGVPRTDRISYIISDNGSGTLKDTAYIYINVDNAAPVAQSDVASTNSGTMVSINVKANDTDPEGALLSAPTISTQPKNGTVSIVGNNIEYTPGTGFTGKDTLIYQVCEAASGSCSSNPLCDTAIVFITVNNQAPTAVADSKTGLPCQEMVINLITNDSDPEGGVLTVTNLSALSNPAAGTLLNNNDGSVAFTPAMGFTGAVTFTYKVTDDGVTPIASAAATVSINISSATNNAPVAVNDVADPSNQDELVYYNVTDNDSDPDGNTLMNPTITVSPLHGAAVVLPNGLIQYTPNAGYYGPDVLTYQVCDYVLNPATCAGAAGLCATATLSYTIKSTGIEISGNIWQDVNGDILENNSESNPNPGVTLYMNLVNNLGNVVQSMPVAGDGNYDFIQVGAGNTYSLVLSLTQGTVGEPTPAASLPSGWVNTGLYLLSTSFNITTGVIGPLAFGYGNSPDFNFGIEQLPNTDALTTNISQPVLNQFVTLNGGSNPPVLSGSDPEDYSGGGVLTNKSVIIDAVPINSELYYNSVLFTNGQQINNFNPALLQIKLTSATIGAIGTSFQYSYVDLAGKKDPTPALYAITWLNPLPVTGLRLTAKLNTDKTVLEWQTESEFNSSYFVIERSLDNQKYESIAIVAAAGNSISKRKYTFTDNLTAILYNPVIYYRIRQVDINANFVFSNVAIIKINKALKMMVWPNPFSDIVQVNIISETNSKYVLRMMDVVGKVVVTQRGDLSSGNNQFIMRDLKHLAPGIYLLQIINNNNQTKELVKLLKL